MKAAIVLALLLAAAPAAAQSLVPGPNQPGRYQMQPVPGGVARLDTVTGDVSLCRVEGGALKCRPSEDADDTAAAPPADDGAEGDDGKDQSRRDSGAYEDDEASPNPSTTERAGRDDTDAELDKAIGRVKRVFRAFRDIAREFEHEDGGSETSPDRT
ncbi:hypothetical protein [Aureimonas leprariae]|uniref:Uncharacterized protein n=1 Tax=Plantimonas leprariae TaxID=2615207 RepID=A0A7V7PQ60_9HYPH|nr:hypothetical protein [Aureimonas leprariae]KAB0680207.1 hypothetical protein F6X38_08445 [Aureimonas leprariae]